MMDWDQRRNFNLAKGKGVGRNWIDRIKYKIQKIAILLLATGYWILIDTGIPATFGPDCR